MRVVLRLYRSDSLVVHETGERFLGRALGAKSAVEHVTLSAAGPGRQVDAQRDPRDRVGKRDLFELEPGEPHPCVAARGRTRGAHGVLEHAAIRERERQRDGHRAFASFLERRAHVPEQRIYHERQPLRAANRVIGPLERCSGQRARQRIEYPARVIGARESPQFRARSTEPDLGFFARDAREIAARLDAGTVEQIGERRIDAEHRYGIRGDELAVVALAQIRHRLWRVARRDLCSDRSVSDGTAHTALDGRVRRERVAYALRSRARRQSANVGPHYVAARRDTRHDAEQRRMQRRRRPIRPRRIVQAEKRHCRTGDMVISL